MISNFPYFVVKVLCRLWPDLYWRRLSVLSGKSGIEQPHFFLSFDCDTDRDAYVAVDLQRKFADSGIYPAWAVPGELLEDHWAQYKQIQDLGGVFLNHGYRRHAEVDPVTGKAVATFGYANVTDEVWKEDIKRGHETVTQLTGVEPRIFRTPHFGEISDNQKFARIHEYIAELGYQLSSSSGPIYGALNGPIFNVRRDLAEFPLSGCLDRPGQLIDSWGFIGAPDAHGKRALLQALGEWLEKLKSGYPLIFNIYFDPADIANEPEIIDLLCCFGMFAVRPFDEKAVMGLLRGDQ